jgi:hypothetical protein
LVLELLYTDIYPAEKKMPNSDIFGSERAKYVPGTYKAFGRLVIDVVSSYITIFSFLGAKIILMSPAEMHNALFIITFLFPEKLDSFYRLPDPVIRNFWFPIFISFLFFSECFLDRNREDRRRGQSLVREE